ncbi:hypothetical protein ABH930_006396 [Kitasatospora sp. GAS204A]|uniref:hypothetical protein n=1 Tax=unclassified Kitasatospora TaxID=2633591 RepID=UPI0024747B61|nr:hypothetical protein [Kitasatospora sp. GAS204B]MDH6122012.1 hypothetical protein [Kitasatospora sp. GAS204B]
MDITEQIATVEARLQAARDKFVNDDNATHEERIALTNQIREDAAVLETLKDAKRREAGAAVRAALMRLK